MNQEQSLISYSSKYTMLNKNQQDALFFLNLIK